MAITKIRAIKNTLKKSLDYIMDAKKTDGQLLVSGLGCAPQIADIEFFLTKNQYDKTDGNLAYHVVQAFLPGEIDEFKAHELGMELANKICGEKYQAVIATHIDKGHIHNHIIFNSVSFTTGEKYNDCKRSYNQIREYNDDICRKSKLSVIENPRGKGVTYKEWSGEEKSPSIRLQIRNDIDEVISTCNSYEEFLRELKNKGYSIKQGKFLSFKPEGKERYVRDRSLGFRYTEESIKARISLKNKETSREMIKADIDRIIGSCRDFDDFIAKMNLAGYSIKRGKFISFKPEGRERYIRGKSIGADYTEEAIRSKIQMAQMGYSVSSLRKENSKIVYRAKNKKSYKKKYNYRKRSLLETNILLVAAIIKELSKEKNTQNVYKPAKKQFVPTKNTEKLKQLSGQLKFIRSEKIKDYKDFYAKIAYLNESYKKAKDALLSLDKLSVKFVAIYKNIIAYKNNKKYYDEIKNTIFKTRLKSKYETEIRLFEFAKLELEKVGIKDEKDIDAFIEKYEKQKEYVNTLKKKCEYLEDKISEYVAFNMTIENIKRKEYVFGKQNVNNDYREQK